MPFFRFVEISDTETHARKFIATEKFAASDMPALTSGSASLPSPLPLQPNVLPTSETPQPSQPAKLPASSSVEGERKRKQDFRQSFAEQRLKALQEVKAEEAGTPSKAAVKEAKDTITPTKKANTDSTAWVVRTAEQSIKVIYSRVAALTMRSFEIQNNVQHIEQWKWLSATPQYADFLNQMKKFEESKKDSPLMRRLLLGSGDLGAYACHILYFC